MRGTPRLAARPDPGSPPVPKEILAVPRPDGWSFVIWRPPDRPPDRGPKAILDAPRPFGRERALPGRLPVPKAIFGTPRPLARPLPGRLPVPNAIFGTPGSAA